MCRVIQRRDPTRPAIWYCSFIAPHPPVVPPRDYFDLYHRLGVDEPFADENRRPTHGRQVGEPPYVEATAYSWSSGAEEFGFRHALIFC